MRRLWSFLRRLFRPSPPRSDLHDLLLLKLKIAFRGSVVRAVRMTQATRNLLDLERQSRSVLTSYREFKPKTRAGFEVVEFFEYELGSIRVLVDDTLEDGDLEFDE